MAKIEVANTLFLFFLNSFFVFPEICAFCLCEVLTRCHRYVTLALEQLFVATIFYQLFAYKVQV